MIVIAQVVVGLEGTNGAAMAALRRRKEEVVLLRLLGSRQGLLAGRRELGDVLPEAGEDAAATWLYIGTQ
jgi:hypothetical protein